MFIIIKQNEWIGIVEMKSQGTSPEGLIPIMEDPFFLDAAFKSIIHTLLPLLNLIDSKRYFTICV